jgi:hypothetical protein
MAEAVLQFLIQLHPVLPHISIDHFDHFLDCFLAVVRKRCDEAFGGQIVPGARWEAILCHNELGNIRSFEEWGPPWCRESHLHLFISDHIGQRIDELTLIVHIVGRGVGERYGAGGGFGPGGSGTATAAGGGGRTRLFS